MTVGPSIRIERLSKAFRGQRVLDGVSLAMEPGDRIALVGPNGAGKTTLIRCLLGEYVCEGDVLVDGRSPRAHRTDVLRRVGFVPQQPPPLKMPVAQLVRFATGLCGTHADEIGRDAARLGLDVRRIRRQPFEKLSGGQKQKLLIAIALRRGADALIMDEPAANLDPEARRALFELLAEREDRATMLISSHRLNEVSGLVLRVVELDRGRVALDERLADAGALGATLECRVELLRREEAAVNALQAWGFCERGAGLVWEGTVPGPDRLRFLGVLARYSGLVSAVRIDASARGGC